jgi:hypothetical protein
MTDRGFLARSALLLAVIISAPCRFSAGIVLMVFFNAVILFGIALNRLTRRVKLDPLLVPFSVYGTVFFTVLYKQLIIMFSPTAALSAGFSFYVTAFCAYETGQYFRVQSETFAAAAADKLSASLKFSAAALTIFFIREALGAGTISFPAPQNLFASGIIEISLPRISLFQSFVFFATVPGAAVLTAAVMTAFFALKKRRSDV